MRKNTLKKAFALLVILAMLLPCIPVLASAEVATAKKLENVSVADAFQYLETNCKSTTEENTYVLDSTDDLAYFMACGRGTATASPFTGNIRFESCTVKLGADITWNEGTASATGFQPKNAGDTVYLWEPYFSAASQYGNPAAGGFQGTFDGCGHAISGLYINTTKHAGFFAALSGVTVKNVRFENCYVENAASSDSFVVGMVAGAVCMASTFEEIIVSNCHLKGAKCVGGIIGGPTTGMNYASAVLKLTDCVIDAKSTVTATESVAGGIMGAIRGKNVVTLTRCVDYATITVGTSGNRNGLIGYDSAAGTVTENCATIGSKYFYNGTGWSAGKAFTLTAPSDGVMSMEIEGVQTKANADETKFDARFVASILLGNVPTENTLVGFEFSQLGEYVADATNVKTKNCASVYTSIKTNFGGSDLTADDFDADYLGTLVITGIPKTGSKSILIRAWYQVDGGAKQYGNYALVTFVNGQIVASDYLTE